MSKWGKSRALQSIILEAAFVKLLSDIFEKKIPTLKTRSALAELTGIVIFFVVGARGAKCSCFSSLQGVGTLSFFSPLQVGANNLGSFSLLCRWQNLVYFLLGRFGVGQHLFLSYLQVGAQHLGLFSFFVDGGATFSCFPPLQVGAQKLGFFLLCRWGAKSIFPLL